MPTADFNCRDETAGRRTAWQPDRDLTGERPGVNTTIMLFLIQDGITNGAIYALLGLALVGATALYLFLKRTYIGTAIRAIAQDREIIGLMGVDQRRIYLVTSAIGGALAGLGACLLALQYDVHPFIGNTFGPLIFMICVLGGLGNMIGGFIAAFIISQIIAIGGYYFSTELSYVLAFMLFIVLMFVRPQGIVRR